MKVKNVIYIIMALLFLTACGGNSVSLKVEPQLGELGEYIKVDSSELTISLKEIDEDGEKYMAIIPTLPVSVIKNVASENGLDFWISAEIYDKNNEELNSFNLNLDSEYDFSNHCYYILEGKYTAESFLGKEKKEEWNKDSKSRMAWKSLYALLRVKGAYVVLTPYHKDATLFEYAN